MKTHSDAGDGKRSTTLPAVVGAPRGGGGPSDEPLRVLVIDDERNHAEAVAESLERVDEGRRYSCVVATSGSAGARKIEQEDFDVVLTDLVMPGREGIETILSLRQEQPGLKIIAVSGAYDGAFLRLAEGLGADATLKKPVSPPQLVGAVRSMLGC